MDLKLLLTPLNPPAGIDLRLTPVFDDLKELRREDDHTVSYGIWTYELKVAHWERLESKTYELLTSQTKDLEIVLWYVECLIQREKIQGLFDGITLLQSFLKTFWDVFFPIDPDYRGTLIEAFDRRLADHILRLNLCGHPDYNVSLLNWKNAQHMHNLLARDPGLEQELIDEYGMTLDIVRNRLSLGTSKFVDDALKLFQMVIDTLKALVVLCDEKIPQAEVSFTDTLKILADAQYVLTKEVHFYTPPEIILTKPADMPVPRDLENNGRIPIKDRTDVYTALQELCTYLEETEPHSPVPSILNMLVNWQNKSLPDIMEDVQKMPEKYRLLYAIVGH